MTAKAQLQIEWTVPSKESEPTGVALDRETTAMAIELMRRMLIAVVCNAEAEDER